MMESRGGGNCINMFSLMRNCGFPCLVLITMRGEFAEFNPWQVPMGSITEATLKLCGFLTYRVDEPDDVDDIVSGGCGVGVGGGVPGGLVGVPPLDSRQGWTQWCAARGGSVARLSVAPKTCLVW